MSLVLSIFPGIGLFDRAFEQEGFCIVRGPDLLWGGRIESFHPPAGKFDGVIGGPPCQAFSKLRYLNGFAGKQGNLIPEFERVVMESAPSWFLMENVPDAPQPKTTGYAITSIVLNNRWVGGEQHRTRRFSFGSVKCVPPLKTFIQWAALEQFNESGAVLAGHGPVGRSRLHIRVPSIQESNRLQGLPENFLSDAPFTVHGKRQMLGNGVPLPMGRAIARAVKQALT